MKKLLLVLVEVLNLEHSIPRGIIIRLTTDCASAVERSWADHQRQNPYIRSLNSLF